VQTQSVRRNLDDLSRQWMPTLCLADLAYTEWSSIT